jgi:acyl-coenzyme A thioesterase PaaI-like protein
LSSEISIRYIAPAVRGDTIRLVSKTVKVGRNTALAETRMYRKSDNKLLVVGFHTKVRCAVSLQFGAQQTQANTNGKHMNVDRVTPKL